MHYIFHALFHTNVRFMNSSHPYNIGMPKIDKITGKSKNKSFGSDTKHLI